jgi:hypothetical protein
MSLQSYTGTKVVYLHFALGPKFNTEGQTLPKVGIVLYKPAGKEYVLYPL